MSIAGKLLVIDDSEMVLERVKARLQRESYEVATTSQPVGAARHLLLCDLVILDFHMPGMNGGEVLRSLKMLGASSGACPLYFLYTSDKALSRGYRELGFDGRNHVSSAHTDLGHVHEAATQTLPFDRVQQDRGGVGKVTLGTGIGT